MVWKLAEAKNRLSELVTRATTEGPQTIRRHGDTVIVIAESEYRALKGEKMTLGQYLLSMPKGEPLARMPRSKMRAPKL
jgi:prevent-host-death family protein